MKGDKGQVVIIILLFPFLLFCLCCRSGDKTPETRQAEKVKLGVEVFLDKHLSLVKEKRVGLITNPSGADSRLVSTTALFHSHPKINLVALYGPEHGVRGNAQPGEYVPFYVDNKYQVPVFSLYGQSRKPEPGMLKNIDEFMRSFDVLDEGKKLEVEMIGEVDVMIFDIQDVGTRIYTYMATMAYCMQACAEENIEFIVLDRPNPLGGHEMEGFLLEYPDYSSFVGLYPIPIRHGMTAGELARLFNSEFLKKKVSLTVIPMEGWERQMWYDDTSLPWVIPSPNMPTLDTATVYPGQVFLEGTNISEGRGTTRPFELFGAPWIDGHELTIKLNGLKLPGIIFRESWFTPTFSKFKGELCGGAQIHVTDRDAYKPFATTLHILRTVMDSHPDEFQFYEDYFDKIMGSSKIREDLENGSRVEDVIQGFAQDLEEFAQKRKSYLIY
jgi:uncharacterized protein YbbC (DUF1343 family)